MQDALSNTNLSLSDKSRLCFALAKVNEDLGWDLVIEPYGFDGGNQFVLINCYRRKTEPSHIKVSKEIRLTVFRSPSRLSFPTISSSQTWLPAFFQVPF